MSVSHRKLSGIPWLQIALETAFVIAGVLLALAVDEWRQGRRDQELVALALRNIHAEMEENRATVQEALSYHRDLIARLQKDPENTGGTPYRPAIIRNNAWEAAQSSQAAAKMDFGVIAAVSGMEELQDHYQKLVQGVMPQVYGSGSTVRLPILLDLLSFEKMLLEVYDETERALASSS